MAVVGVGDGGVCWYREACSGDIIVAVVTGSSISRRCIFYAGGIIVVGVGGIVCLHKLTCRSGALVAGTGVDISWRFVVYAVVSGCLLYYYAA